MSAHQRLDTVLDQDRVTVEEVSTMLAWTVRMVAMATFVVVFLWVLGATAAAVAGDHPGPGHTVVIPSPERP